MFHRVPVVLALLLGLTTPVAALDPEVMSPYKVQVVLRFTEHRLMTPILRDRLVRELRDGLEAALGSMGTVEVVDLGKVPAAERPPLWREVERNGLQKGLEGATQGLSDRKTHFLVIDFVDGQYEIQSRQFDGFTGLSSPAVRRERTTDREFVARTAALLVDRDFGLVGTVMQAADAQRVKVAFKGSGLGVSLDRWIKKHDVFAVVELKSGSAGPRANRVAYTLLRLEELPGADGLASCRVFQPRDRVLAEGGGTLGFRCLKLGTIRGPLRLQLVRANPDPRNPSLRPPAPSLEIQVRRTDFTGDEPDRAIGASDTDGFFSTHRQRDPNYEGVAFVTVMNLGQVRARIPIPIVDDRTEILPITIATDASGPYLIRKSLWEDGLLLELAGQTSLFNRLNGLLTEMRRDKTPESAQKAFQVAKSGLEGANKSLESLENEHKELKEELARASVTLDLSGGISRLAEIRKNRDQLASSVAALEKIINDPTLGEFNGLLAQAQLHERESDFSQALALYKKALALGDDPMLRQRVAKLEQAWTPRDERHREARTFLAEVWPQVAEPPVLRRRLEEATNALAECQRVGDVLGPRLLIKGGTAHVTRLSKDVTSLPADDVKAAQEFADLLDALGKLLQATNAYLAKNAAP